MAKRKKEAQKIGGFIVDIHHASGQVFIRPKANYRYTDSQILSMLEACAKTYQARVKAMITSEPAEAPAEKPKTPRKKKSEPQAEEA